MSNTPKQTVEAKIRTIAAALVTHGYNDKAKGLKDPTKECEVFFQEQVDQIMALLNPVEIPSPKEAPKGKPSCTEDSPCGCHFGEVFHADGKCACDFSQPQTPDKEKKDIFDTFPQRPSPIEEWEELGYDIYEDLMREKMPNYKALAIKEMIDSKLFGLTRTFPQKDIEKGLKQVLYSVFGSNETIEMGRYYELTKPLIAFIRSLLLRKDQEADRRVREAIGEIVIYGELLIENNHNYLTEVKAIGYEENNEEAVKSFWNALKNKLSQDKGKLSSK